MSTADVQQQSSLDQDFICHFCCRARHAPDRSSAYPHVCKACSKTFPREVRLLRQSHEMNERVHALQDKLTQTSNVRRGLSTVMQFFEALDEALDGVEGITARFAICLDELMKQGEVDKASKLLLNIQKMRLLLERMNIAEDFSQLNLEEKQQQLNLEIMKFLKDIPSAEQARYLQLMLSNMNDTDRQLVINYATDQTPNLLPDMPARSGE